MIHIAPDELPASLPPDPNRDDQVKGLASALAHVHRAARHPVSLRRERLREADSACEASRASNANVRSVCDGDSAGASVPTMLSRRICRRTTSESSAARLPRRDSSGSDVPTRPHLEFS